MTPPRRRRRRRHIMHKGLAWLPFLLVALPAAAEEWGRPNRPTQDQDYRQDRQDRRSSRVGRRVSWSGAWRRSGGGGVRPHGPKSHSPSHPPWMRRKDGTRGGRRTKWATRCSQSQLTGAAERTDDDDAVRPSLWACQHLILSRIDVSEFPSAVLFYGWGASGANLYNVTCSLIKCREITN